MNEKWIFQIPDLSQADSLCDLYPCRLTQRQSEMMIGHFRAAAHEQKELIIGAVLRKDMKIKCLFEVYNIAEDLCTIGYRCLYTERKRHYTSSSLPAILMHLKACGIKRVYAECSNNNIPSIAILEHHGFQLADKDEEIRKYQYDFYK